MAKQIVITVKKELDIYYICLCLNLDINAACNAINGK